MFWRQRSRLNWDLMGDQNTYFFHLTATVRRRRNKIQALQNKHGEWLVIEDEIKKQFVRHFKQIYKADTNTPPNNLIQFMGELRDKIVKVPLFALSDLEELPTEQEIVWLLMHWGP